MSFALTIPLWPFPPLVARDSLEGHLGVIPTQTMPDLVGEVLQVEVCRVSVLVRAPLAAFALRRACLALVIAHLLATPVRMTTESISATIRDLENLADASLGLNVIVDGAASCAKFPTAPTLLRAP